MRALALAALAALSLSCERPRTQVIVVVDTDIAWRGPTRDLTQIEIVVRSGSRDGPERFARTIDPGNPAALPLSFGVTPVDGDASRLVWVRVRGCGARGCDTPLVERRALTGFVEGQTTRLDMFLAASCVNVTCDSPLQTCRPEGGCGPEAQPASSLPRFDPAAPLTVDAGARTDAADAADAFDGATGVDAADVTDATVTRDATDVADAGETLPPWRRLAVGRSHACLLRGRDKLAVCWGMNNRCQGGVGVPGNPACPLITAPARTISAEAWLDIAAGSNFTCALRVDRTVACWGSGAEGPASVLVLGADVGDTPAPQTIPGLVGIDRVVAGDFHACALDRRGRAWCWGDNRFFALGTDAGPARAQPVAINDSPALADIAAGGATTCGMSAAGEGTAFCWGLNDHGQAGAGQFANGVSFLPVRRPSPGFATLDVGKRHACGAQRDSGSVWCWGIDHRDDAGMGTNVPALHVADAGALALALGTAHTCYVEASASPRVRCYGSRQWGQTGSGVSDIPARAPDLVALQGITRIDEIAAGEGNTCVRAGEEVWCWGEDSYGQTSGTPPLDGGVADGAVRVDVATAAPVAIARVAPVRVPLPD